MGCHNLILYSQAIFIPTLQIYLLINILGD